MKTERIDKMLSLCTGLSRSEVKKLMREKSVSVNGESVIDGSLKIPENCFEVTVSGSPVVLRKYVYIMLNKPAGVICASDGKGEKTVIDVLPSQYKRRGLFPAGRLDRDTVGFCLVTDDGGFAHKILSPKSYVPKTYLARLDKPINIESAAMAFREGMDIAGEKLLPAVLLLVSGGDRPLCEVVIQEGKYHQVKLMFGKLGYAVTMLKRTKIGGLELDRTLAEGECRYITDSELSAIY